MLNIVELLYSIFRENNIPDEITIRILYIYKGLQHPIIHNSLDIYGNNSIDNLNYTYSCRCIWVNRNLFDPIKKTRLGNNFEIIECINCSIKKDTGISWHITYDDLYNDNIYDDLVECDICGRIWDGNAQCDCDTYNDY
jgi:hypothetical protein